jgi:hypothetical protein
MRQPSTYHIREFINRGENVSGNGLIVQKETVANVTRELADLLAFTLELQNEIADLKEQAEKNQITDVELIGKDF